MITRRLLQMFPRSLRKLQLKVDQLSVMAAIELCHPLLHSRVEDCSSFKISRSLQEKYASDIQVLHEYRRIYSEDELSMK